MCHSGAEDGGGEAGGTYHLPSGVGQAEEAIRGTNGDGRRLDLDEHTIQYTDDVL